MSTITAIITSLGTFIDVILGAILVVLVFRVMWPMFQFISHEQTADE
jgi:uncharacterized membrane protein YccC